MRDVSRRTVLKATGVGAAVAAVGWPQIRLAAPSAVAAGADDQTLLANITASFVGTSATNADPVVQTKLTGLYRTAKSNLAAMATVPTTQLFNGLPLGTNDANLTSTYLKLSQIAFATAMPLPSGSTVPTDLAGNTTVQNRVIDALSWLYDNYFGDQATGYYGNWYNWEIGIPMHASRTLAVLHDRLEAYRPDLAATYVHAMDLYLRSGKNGDVDLDSRFDTGANLADMTTNRIVQGAVLGDDARITKAIADQLTVYDTIDPYNLQHGVTDGFYADGSFIQHASVAYTGSYGTGLLSRVAATIAMLDGTAYASNANLAAQVNGWMSRTFAPVIAQGWMMEMIKGRAISRTTTGYKDAVSVVESAVTLSAYAGSPGSGDLKSYVKYLHDIPQVAIDPNSFTSPTSVQRYAEIVSDASIPAADLLPQQATFVFNAMDRNVHRRAGYTFALSRSSTRISKYEYMSGENLLPWFQGDGAHYLYLAGDDQSQAYGVDYVTAVQPYRLGGVTSPVEERKTIPELYGEQFYDNPAAGFTSSSVSQNTYVYFPLGTNDYSGGAQLGAYAVAGMVQSDDAAYVAKSRGELPDDFVAYANSRSQKSWFMFDDEIVVLVAGVTDLHGRDVLTTIDSRIAATTDDVSVTGSLRGGASFVGPGSASNPRWLQYANATRKTVVGYVFFADAAVDVGLQDVQRSRQLVRASNPNTIVSKNVFSLSVAHAAAESPGALAYAIVPGGGVDALERYDGSTTGPVILANSTDLQAVRHPQLGLVAANSYSIGTHQVGKLSIDGAASVIVQDADGGRTRIAVSDPTFGRDEIAVTVPGRRPVVEPHDGVTVQSVTGGTRLVFATHHAYGATVTVTLQGQGVV